MANANRRNVFDAHHVTYAQSRNGSEDHPGCKPWYQGRTRQNSYQIYGQAQQL